MRTSVDNVPSILAPTAPTRTRLDHRRTLCELSMNCAADHDVRLQSGQLVLGVCEGEPGNNGGRADAHEQGAKNQRGITIHWFRTGAVMGTRPSSRGGAASARTSAVAEIWSHSPCARSPVVLLSSDSQARSWRHCARVIPQLSA